jgi:hypothetical protein
MLSLPSVKENNKLAREQDQMTKNQQDKIGVRNVSREPGMVLHPVSTARKHRSGESQSEASLAKS